MTGYTSTWLIIFGGVVMGICGAFFGPAMQALMPELLHKEHRLKGNSLMSMSSTGISIIGKSMGGVLFQTLGAPLLILLNGISFILSGMTEVFIKIKEPIFNNHEKHFMEDLKEGARYIKKEKGIRYLFVAIGFLNFFALMTLILILPYFNSVESFGPDKYGITMAASTVGVLVGYFLLSTFNFNKLNQHILFSLSGIISGITMALIVVVPSLTSILFLMGINGITVAIVRSIIQTAIQSNIEKTMIGKVSGFKRSLSSILSPLGVMSGGFLAELISINFVMITASLVVALLFGLLLFNRHLKRLFSN